MMNGVSGMGGAHCTVLRFGAICSTFTTISFFCRALIRRTSLPRRAS